ncbi:hypothetical protein RUM44_007965 [Polyplax serrata]|uniref:Uncharacterized protein n=1 Tax=Polyplax serrata TaxID=468196 RepID=A0ABR1BBU7_POLSC
MTKKKMESRRGTTRYTRLAPREQFNSLRTVLNRGGAVSSTVQVFIQTTILSCLRGAGSVSAGQHMQLTGDLKPNVSVAGQQQQGMFFSQQSETYTVSQSQTINFTQQNLRGRSVGPVPRAEQQHKLLQQQQLIRAQQQQMGIRPPPPEYKPSQPQMMHSMPQQRFQAAAIRRPGPGQQPMPPSAGPMMRPQHTTGGTVFMGGPTMTRNMAPGYLPRQRPPNVSVGPDGMPMSNRSGVEWRHILMSQQQNMGFTHNRPFATHQGNFAPVQNNPGGMQMHPQRRGQLPPGSAGQMQMLPQDQVIMQGQPNNSNQMSMNLQMTQSQSMSLSSGIVNPHHHMHHMTPNNSHLHQFSNSSGFTNTSNNSFVNSQGGPTSSGTQTTISSSSNGNNMNTSSGNNGGTGNGNNNHNNNNNHNHNNSSNGCGNNSNNNPNDFGFEFLDSLPGDPSFSAQDLLSSLDSTSNFNINDIL